MSYSFNKNSIRFNSYNLYLKNQTAAKILLNAMVFNEFSLSFGILVHCQGFNQNEMENPSGTTCIPKL